MADLNQNQQQEIVRDRFTRTAQVSPMRCPEYIETQRLMEATIPDDLAAFHPRYSASNPPGSDEAPAIDMVNTVVFFAAEKIG